MIHGIGIKHFKDFRYFKGRNETGSQVPSLSLPEPFRDLKAPRSEWAGHTLILTEKGRAGTNMRHSSFGPPADDDGWLGPVFSSCPVRQVAGRMQALAGRVTDFFVAVSLMEFDHAPGRTGNC